jgi:hypothetical protein
LAKNWAGLHFGRFFSQTHPVTLLSVAGVGVARWHIFKPKSLFGKIFKWLAIEYVGIFYGHLAYFTAIRSILRPLGLFCDHLIYFMVILQKTSCFGMLHQ